MRGELPDAAPASSPEAASPSGSTGRAADGEARKRVIKACDRCRVKKVKCCGSMPCVRCEVDDAVCCFGARGKLEESPVSAAQVRQLRAQQHFLSKALRVLWERGGGGAAAAQGDGAASGRDVSLHTIVKSTGVLDEAQELPLWMESGGDFDTLFDGVELRGNAMDAAPAREFSGEPLLPGSPSATNIYGSFDGADAQLPVYAPNPLYPESAAMDNPQADGFGDDPRHSGLAAGAPFEPLPPQQRGFGDEWQFPLPAPPIEYMDEAQLTLSIAQPGQEQFQQAPAQPIPLLNEYDIFSEFTTINNNNTKSQVYAR